MYCLAIVGIYPFVILFIYIFIGWRIFGGCYGSGSLLSILLLCISTDMACCVAMTLIASNAHLMLKLGVLNVVSIPSLEGVCVATLAHVVIRVREVFQALVANCR